MERFIKEYANYKLKKLRGNSAMQDKYKNSAIARIKRIIAVRERELLTAEEAVKLLLTAESDAWKQDEQEEQNA